MSFSDVIARTHQHKLRKEDFSLFYGSDEGLVEENSYRNYKYEIRKTSSYPYIVIIKKENGSLPILAKFENIKLKNASGDEKVLEKTFVMDGNGGLTKLEYRYNKDSDYVYELHTGICHTLDEMKKDCIAFIDNLIKLEDIEFKNTFFDS